MRTKKNKNENVEYILSDVRSVCIDLSERNIFQPSYHNHIGHHHQHHSIIVIIKFIINGSNFHIPCVIICVWFFLSCFHFIFFIFIIGCLLFFCSLWYDNSKNIKQFEFSARTEDKKKKLNSWILFLASLSSWCW